MGISVRDFLIELIEELHPECRCIILWAGMHFELWVKGNSSFLKSLLLRYFHSKRNKVKASKPNQNKMKKKLIQRVYFHFDELLLKMEAIEFELARLPMVGLGYIQVSCWLRRSQGDP